MIVFDLKCSKGHTFEDWFGSTQEYESMKEMGELECPQCGDSDVTKGLMAPAVAVSSPSDAPSCSADPGGTPGCGMGGCGGGMCGFE